MFFIDIWWQIKYIVSQLTTSVKSVSSAISMVTTDKLDFYIWLSICKLKAQWCCIGPFLKGPFEDRPLKLKWYHIEELKFMYICFYIRVMCCQANVKMIMRGYVHFIGLGDLRQFWRLCLGLSIFFLQKTFQLSKRWVIFFKESEKCVLLV